MDDLTFYEPNDNAQLVGLIFRALITDLEDRPLAEVLGFEQGEEDICET